MKHDTIKQEFYSLDAERSTLLREMRMLAHLVAPSLIPLWENTSASTLKTDDLLTPEVRWNRPAQNASALASQLTASLFPPNDIPFAAFEEGKALRNLNVNPEVKMTMQTEVTKIENDILGTLQSSKFRTALYTALHQAIVLPNALIVQEPDNSFRNYRFDQFVLERDYAGKITKIITVDWLNPDNLEPRLQPLKKAMSYGAYEPLYTKLEFDKTKRVWKISQEFCDNAVPLDSDEYPEKYFPYYVLMWEQPAHRTYGVSLCEKNSALIRTGEAIANALVDGLAAGSEGRIAIDPTGITESTALEDTPNWGTIAARQQDIWVLQANVNSTVTVAQAALNLMDQELDKVFMANASARLTGERVTAYQVQSLTQEQSEVLGNFISQVGEHILEPVWRNTFKNLKDEQYWPEGTPAYEVVTIIDNEGFNVKIKTGLDALGRQLETARLAALAQTFMATQNPEVMSLVKWDVWARKFVNASGLDPTDILKTVDEIRAEAQAQQEAAMAQQVAQQAIQSAGNIAQTQLG